MRRPSGERKVAGELWCGADIVGPEGVGAVKHGLRQDPEHATNRLGCGEGAEDLGSDERDVFTDDLR